MVCCACDAKLLKPYAHCLFFNLSLSSNLPKREIETKYETGGNFMQPLSNTNMSCTPDEIFQNLRKGPRLEKTDILSFKSSEILPFRFYSFPEFNEKMKKYVQKSPTRIFPRNAAETLLQRGGAGGIVPLSAKYCCLDGKGMLRPPRSFEETPNEPVDVSWNTICGVFSHPEKVTESRIILPNNFHLKTLLEKAGFCM